ncbi:MAG: hypothetical protein ACHQT7_02595 [Candidatus Levyibacteriota bacterium]
MPSSERRIFSNHKLSRRNLLIATGMVAGAAASSSLGVGPREVGSFLEISYEYGPEVARAVLSHPGQSLEAFKLWKGPDRAYEKSSVFAENLVYRKGSANNIIGFGDSNLVGPDGTNWQESPIVLYKDLAVQEKGVENWQDFNCAKGGSTTDMIIQQQVPSQRAMDGFGMGVGCDVWINAGGNDVANLVHNVHDVEELRRLTQNPFADMDLLFKYTGRIEDNLQNFETNFLNLLHAIYNPLYVPNIRQFVIMSMPDFGRARSIITQEFNGGAYIIDLKSSAVRRLIGNISILMNNAIFKSVETFQKETGSRIIGINAARGGMSDFSSNQHYSEAACQEIAQTALSRMDVTAA